MIRVSPAALIEFFDKDNEENSEQASAINGVAGEELALEL